MKKASLKDLRKMKEEGKILPTKEGVGGGPSLPENFWDDAIITIPNKGVE